MFQTGAEVAMEMCPEGALRADEYLSSFNLCSLTLWRHNIQNELTNGDSFGANPEFCFSQGKALLGYRGLSGSPEQPRAAAFCDLWFFKSPVCDLDLGTLTGSCSVLQHGPNPLGSAAFSCPHPLTPGMVWFIREQSRKKGMRQLQSSKSITLDPEKEI